MGENAIGSASTSGIILITLEKIGDRTLDCPTATQPPKEHPDEA
jgi:hypothetical protein